MNCTKKRIIKLTGTIEENSGGVPTFIRVVVIRRIVLNYIKHYIDDDDKNDEYIKGLISEMRNLEDSMVTKKCPFHAMTRKIVSNLL